ncbi:MAG: succinate dehydrogenase cytochrome b subunit [Fidelibacterota bacterium]
MSWFINTFRSSIGKKVLVGATGILLFLYVIIHLAGNLVIYAGNEAYNRYAEILGSIPLLLVIEIALAAVFLVHIVLVVFLALENRGARGKQRYHLFRSKRDSRSESLASRTMLLSGTVVLIFLLVHVYDFRWQMHEDTDLAYMVKSTLAEPGRALLYIVGSLLVGWHLFHGIHSAFLSLGVNHPRYSPLIEKLGFVFSFILGLGFASIPFFIWIGVAR